MTLLRTVELTVTFGGVRALDRLDLDVHAGQLVGLIGPNGAGKTSCIDAITGFVQSVGQLEFDGHRLERMPPHRRSGRGLARTWQSLELFDDLTVEENLLVAADSPGVVDILKDLVAPTRRRPRRAVDAALDLLGLGDLAKLMPGQLSHGQRKLVSTARALAGSPRLICMDEPAAGLDSSESATLGDRLREIVDGGTSILLVDHDMDLVLRVCDYVYVIDFGVKIAEGRPADVARDPAVVAAYLGRAT